MRIERGLVIAMAAALTLLGGCNTLGVGTRVIDLQDGRFRIVTSQADDVVKENAAAAHEQCPGGYSILQKGITAEAAYGSLIRGSDLAGYWIIRCAVKK